MFDVERPFGRLLRHFIYRIFYGAGEGDDLQFGIPALLGIFATPAAFASIMLFGKYSTLVLYLLGRPAFDVYRASIPDEYFFIVFSMVVTGSVVVLKWSRLFPDRQDFDNLAPLPISTIQIFLASLLALLFLAILFAVDINIAAWIIFPYAVTSLYDTFTAYASMFIAHGTAVILASLLAYFGLLTVIGSALAITPSRYVRRVSIVLRILSALSLVAILASSFTVPRMLLSEDPPGYLRYLPPVWLLDVQQALLGRGAPFTGSALIGVGATIIAFGAALGVYALTYYRLFTRIPEQTALFSRRRDSPSLMRRVMETVFLPSAFQRGTYYFACRALFRSERHCLLFGAAAGVGFFAGAGIVSEAIAAPAVDGVDPRLLSVPFVLSYVIVCTLRALYDVPTDREANWVFRSIVDRYRHVCRPVAMKVMMTMIVPWLVVAGLPLHVWAWGWSFAVLHTIYVLLWAVALAGLLLTGFRKIPFTCQHTASKDRVLVMCIVFMIGLSFFVSASGALELWLFQRPVRLMYALLIFVGFCRGIRFWEKSRHLNDRVLIFEDRPSAVIQLLNLNSNR